MNDLITLTRAVEATQIPSGYAITLEAGTPVSITQSLGGSFTVHAASSGGLFRITAADADALGMEPSSPEARAEGPFNQELVWNALREVYDPEIPVNIVDLGLIYDMKAEEAEGGHTVLVQMTLTAPGCGMGRRKCRRSLGLGPTMGSGANLTARPRKTRDRLTN
jgi:hypothetical protein